MGTKLTLQLDDALIKDIKKIAKAKRVSLSSMVSNYFKSLLNYQKKEEIKSPILLEITGILSPRIDNKKLIKSYKKHIEEKYL